MRRRINPCLRLLFPPCGCELHKRIRLYAPSATFSIPRPGTRGCMTPRSFGRWNGEPWRLARRGHARAVEVGVTPGRSATRKPPGRKARPMQPCPAPTPDLAALLRISALSSREPASSRAMARNEAGRGRAKAHGAARPVDGRAEVRGREPAAKRLSLAIPATGWRPRLVPLGTTRRNKHRQAADTMPGGT